MRALKNIALSCVSNAKVRSALILIILIAESSSIALFSSITLNYGVLFSLLVACLITVQFVLLIILLLRRVSEEWRQLFSSVLFRSGIILSLFGVLGFCLITVLSGRNDATNSRVINMASLMLMAGLSLGIPLVVTTMYEDDHQKRLKESACRDQSAEDTASFTDKLR